MKTTHPNKKLRAAIDAKYERTSEFVEDLKRETGQNISQSLVNHWIDRSSVPRHPAVMDAVLKLLGKTHEELFS